MRNLSVKSLIASFLIMSGVLKVHATAPVLFFSDLTSGPKTGLGDGLGSGIIVTVWGTNLGSSQGSSTIQVGGVSATYVYYWKNADGTLPGGPAELFKYQKMEEVAFSVPATAVDGANTISVTVGGATSNTLPFSVRPGRIFFVKGSGTDCNTSGCGTWSQPWKTMTYAVDHPGIQAGDTMYVADNLIQTVIVGEFNGNFNGTASNPIVFVSYPGYRPIGEQQVALPTVSGIAVYSHSTSSTDTVQEASRGEAYWIFSKLVSRGYTNLEDGSYHGRWIGNEVTEKPGLCGSGLTGAIGISYSLTVVQEYGNYIHDSGCGTSGSQTHTIYISYGDGNYTYEPYDWGWNHIENNLYSSAFQIYTEHKCGGFTGTSSIHDNVIVNQRGLGVNISAGCDPGVVPGTSAVYNVYNNLMINVGRYSSCDAAGASNCSQYPIGVGFEGPQNPVTIYFYNNTIYGYGDPAANRSLITGIDAAGYQNYGFSGTLYYRNNLFVDTLGGVFYNPYSTVASFPGHSNNLWYSTFGDAPPSWDTNPLTANPMFVDTRSSVIDLGLQSGSPAIGAGYNTGPMVTRDILGTPRTIPYSIGAFQFQGTVVSAPPAAPRGFILK